MRFIWDEGRDMTAIYNLVANHNLTLFGPYNEFQGTKDFFGVFHYYLMAPALWIAKYDPIGPAAFTALLGVASVYLTYQVVKMWSSDKVALVTTALYAVSPVVIQFVQWPWNPNTTPFFSLLYFLVISDVFKNKIKYLLGSMVSGLLLGLLFQLHYFTLPLVVPFLVLLLSSSLAARKKLMLLGIFAASFTLPNLTFVLFDLTHEFFYFKIIKESFFSSHADSYLQFSILSFFTSPVVFIYQTFAKLGFGSIFGYAVTVLFIGLLLLIYRRFYLTRKVDLSFLIVTTLSLFLIATSFFPTLLDLYHAAYLWWGLLFILIFETSLVLKTQHFYLLTIVIGVCFSWYQLQRMQQLPDWSQNMPLVRTLAKVIVKDLEKSPSDNFNIATFTDADSRGIRYRYFLLKDHFLPAGIDQYPLNEIIYIITPYSELKTKTNPAWEIESVRTIPWELLSQEAGVTVFKAQKK